MPARLVVPGLLVILIGIPALAFADTPEEESTERLDEALAQPGVATSIMIGRALLESGDAAGALPYYKRAWDADPTHRETGLRLAEVAVLAGQARLALEVLEVLIEQDPQDVAVGVRLGRLRFVVGDDEGARQLGEQLYAAHPEDPEVLELRLDLQEGVRDREGALSTIDELLQVRGEDAELYVRRGETLAEMGRFDEAEADWRRALEIDPGFAEASGYLTGLLLQQGRQDELMEELQRLVDSGNAEPRQAASLADLYLRAGRNDEATEVLIPLAASGELDRPGELLLIQLLGDLGRHDEALDLLEQVEVEDPGRAPVLRLRGELLLDVEDFEGAETALRKALEVDPADNGARVTLLLVLSGLDPDLLRPDRAPGSEFDEILEAAGVEIDPRSLRQHFLVGAMLRRQQRYEEAVPFLERAAALPGASEQVLFELAVAQQESGRRRAAAGTLEQLLKRNPDSPDYLNFYGYLLAEDGRELERAREMIDRALEADPDNGAYIDSLGWVLYQQGDLEGALDQLIRAVNVLGDDPVVLEHLGDCLRDLGRIDEARRTYERALQAGAPDERIEERLRGLDELEAP
jgi:tetratricopeptide (TPR) repeat protein